MTTLTDEQRRAKLASAGLDPDGSALVKRPADRPITKEPARIQWAPEGVDPHTMPVTDIVFTPEMVEHFPDLSPRSRKAPYTHLFEQYKAYGRDKDRNSLLGRRIGEFLGGEHKRRQPGGGYVQDKIRMANTLVQHDVTETDLDEFIAWKRAQEG